MEQKQLDSVKLSTLERFIKKTKKQISPKRDCDISFEFLIGSFFPEVLNNIKKEFTKNYITGYNAAKEQFYNENKGNN